MDSCPHSCCASVPVYYLLSLDEVRILDRGGGGEMDILRLEVVNFLVQIVGFVHQTRFVGLSCSEVIQFTSSSVLCLFFFAWWSSAEFVLKRPNYRHTSIHGELKFTEGQLRVFTDQIRVKMTAKTAPHELTCAYCCGKFLA